jgi:hypothetical protein
MNVAVIKNAVKANKVKAVDVVGAAVGVVAVVANAMRMVQLCRSMRRNRILPESHLAEHVRSRLKAMLLKKPKSSLKVQKQMKAIAVVADAAAVVDVIAVDAVRVKPH